MTICYCAKTEYNLYFFVEELNAALWEEIYLAIVMSPIVLDKLVKVNLKLLDFISLCVS